jgi:hypothetical protein
MAVFYTWHKAPLPNSLNCRISKGRICCTGHRRIYHFAVLVDLAGDDGLLAIVRE